MSPQQLGSSGSWQEAQQPVLPFVPPIAMQLVD